MSQDSSHEPENYNNLFIEFDEDSDTGPENPTKFFTSTESSNHNDEKNRFKNTIVKSPSIDSNMNIVKNNDITNVPESTNLGNSINATNGVSILIQSNSNPQISSRSNSSSSQKSDSDSESNNSESPDYSNNKNKNINKQKSAQGITTIVKSMLNKTDDNTNGWDHNANVTIKNWYKIFKQQSFIYQTILDKNLLISDRLSVVSIISSSILGIFSGFKIWINNDKTFQVTSDIMLMFLNFTVALITSLSKRYIDDKRNEEIRAYIIEVDNFIGEISAQVLKTSMYRMPANKFFKLNNDKYTRLIATAPNMSITELTYGKQKYKNFIEQAEDIIV